MTTRATVLAAMIVLAEAASGQDMSAPVEPSKETANGLHVQFTFGAQVDLDDLETSVALVNTICPASKTPDGKNHGLIFVDVGEQPAGTALDSEEAEDIALENCMVEELESPKGAPVHIEIAPDMLETGKISQSAILAMKGAIERTCGRVTVGYDGWFEGMMTVSTQDHQQDYETPHGVTTAATRECQ